MKPQSVGYATEENKKRPSLITPISWSYSYLLRYPFGISTITNSALLSTMDFDSGC